MNTINDVADRDRERDLAISEGQQAIQDLQDHIDKAENIINNLDGGIIDAKSAIEILETTMATT